MSYTADEELVNRSSRLLTVLSKRNNLSLFMSAKSGLKAEAPSPERTRLSKKVYYTSLKQLINNGLVEKSDGKYVHTTFGSIVYQSHIIRLIDQLRNQKQMVMIDTLKHSDQFSENDILLASRHFNEIIINNILRKAKSGINVKVVAEKMLVDQFFEQNIEHLQVNDKNAVERINVVGNPWYPGNVSRRLANVPFSMTLFDRREVAIELINANEPKSFHGAIFIRDEKSCKRMLEYYQKLWDSGLSDDSNANANLISETSASRRYHNRQ